MTSDIKPIVIYDNDLDLFENQYRVPRGISYNSFVICDDKIALLDTVDRRRAAEWRERLAATLPPGRALDYLIVQHLEPDHASQIGWVMAQYPDCRLVCTAAAHKMLPMLVDTAPFDGRVIEVADGDTLSLGRHTLEFVTAPMVHWPEVMMVYDDLSGTLFSADGFGRFGNPDPSRPWAPEARRYYFNIVGKYGRPVQTVLKKLAGRRIDTIAPLHGPILEGDLTPYLTLYDTWSSYSVETPGVMVAYASIHGMTQRAALWLAEVLLRDGAPHVELVDLCYDDMSRAVEKAFGLSHLVAMASTYDGEIFPPMHDFIHHLAIKGYNSRRVAIVENGLWAPAAGRKMTQMFERMNNITIVPPMVTIHGRLTPATETQLRTLATNLLKQ